MDAMALLCNVHADGPATRKLLRRAGCDSLEALLAIPPEELAGILGSSPSFARRILQEAENLAARVGSSLLERDEEETMARSQRSQTAPARAAPEPPPTRKLTPTERTAEPLRPGLLAGLDRTWCERLARRGVATLEALAQAPGLELSRELGFSYPRLLELQCLAQRFLSTAIQPARLAPDPEPQGAEPAVGESLRPGLLEGLDEPWCRRLAALGVTTLEALVDAPGLEFSRQLGLPYPQLLDLQHLARRFLATTLKPVAARPSRTATAPSRGELQPASSALAGKTARGVSDPGPSGPFG